MIVFASAWLVMCMCRPVGDEPAAAFVDPAPPSLRVLEPAKAPVAGACAGWTGHAEPRARVAGARDEDWPGFLGPRRDATCRETGLLEVWPADGPRVLWEMERGEGYASPAVAGERVVFTHRIGAQVHIDCLELTTGRRFWRRSYPCDYQGEYISNAGPRATPLIHRGRVYVHDIQGRLYVLDLPTGREIWQRDLSAEFKVRDSFFGVVSSPLIHDDRLIVNLGAASGPCVAAFDIATGKLAWGAGAEWGASCASPVLATLCGRERLLVLAGDKSRPPTGGLLVIEPRAGAIEWRYPFRSRTYESVIGASPVAVADGVLLTASYNTGTALIGVDAQGGFAERWHNRRFGLQFATPVVIGDAVYAVDGVSGRAGALVRIDPQTGAERWRMDIDEEVLLRLEPEERRVAMSVGEGSLLVLGERLLCLGDTGLLLLIEPAAAGGKVVARTALFHAGDTWTPPVVSHGILLLCQNTQARFSGRAPRLIALDLRAGDG